MKRKKASTAITIVALLVLALAGLQILEVAKANPYMHDYVEEDVIPLPADNSPPSIQILHPTNNTAFNSNNITLTFNVTFNKSNNISLSLTELYYKPSWQTTNNYLDLYALYVANNYSPVTSFSVNLTDVSEGPRWIEIFATAKAFAYETYHTISGIMYTQHYVSYLTEASAMVNFTIDQTPPTITIISPQNITYPPTGIPLNFTVTESTSWVGYSINNQANITLKGNTTLRVQGLDLLVIYANDTAANTGKSGAIFFEVGPTPYLPSYNPPTQQPTLEPSLTASPTEPIQSFKPLPYSLIITVTIVIIAAIVAVGLLLYLAKYRRVKR